MRSRWLVVLVTAALLVLVPLAVTARPAARSSVTAPELASRVQASVDVGWSGSAQASGTLRVPESDSFATLSVLLGETNQLRAWWRGPGDWRVDRITSTGETDLFRQRGRSVRWVFESETATVSPVSEFRLPDASDLLPPTLGRSMLQGARADELTRLPTRRVAGRAAAGLRLTPQEAGTTVGHVDVWADEASELPLRVEVFGRGESRPVLTTSLLDLDLTAPDAATTDFTPSAGVTVNYEESVDVAAAANAFAPFDLPATLGGLAARSGREPGAVGVYGRGPTTLMALPLRDRVAWPLRHQLEAGGTAQDTAVGLLAPVGPVNLLVTSAPVDDGEGGAFLLVGTVNSATLQQAAAELARRRS